MSTEPSTKIAAPINGGRGAIAAPGLLAQQRAASATGLDEIARDALGTPLEGHEGELSAAVGDRVLSVGELRSIWGLSLEQLDGLSSLGVIWQDGINETELKTIADYRKEVKEMFGKLFGKEMPDRVFDQIWKLVLTGRLDKDSWNDLMKRYGFKMNSESFRVLLGGENGSEYKDEKRVENIAEFKLALESLILTMEYRIKPTGDHEQDEKQALDYPVYMKRYCSSRNFNVFSVDKAEGSLTQILASIAGKKGLDFNKYLKDGKLDKDLLLSGIRQGDLGDQLQRLVKELEIEDWTKFLVALLRFLEEAVSKGVSAKDSDAEGISQQLDRSRRMQFINRYLSGKEKDDGSMFRELERLFSGEKPDFDYERVRKGE